MLSTAASFFRHIVLCCACAVIFGTSAVPALAAPELSPQPQPATNAQPASNVQAAAAQAASAQAASEPDTGTELADFAEQYVGSPYRWGGASPSGFDCTGFVMWVFGQFGVSLPHNEAGQLASGARVSADDLQPGDVLVFANTYRAGLSHVGIYVGDGQFVHAVDEAHGVMVSALWDGYWAPRLVGASRAIA